MPKNPEGDREVKQIKDGHSYSVFCATGRVLAHNACWESLYSEIPRTCLLS